jgi:hypothetical protein
MRNLNKALLATSAFLTFSSAAMANDIAPWTPAQGGGEAEISYNRQEATLFNPGEAEASLPDTLSLDTVALSLSYGLSNRLAADVQVGYAKSKFPVVPGLAPQGGLDGLTDIQIGLRYKVLDELDGAPLTVTVGVAGIIAGGYDTGALSAIGDGGSGGQAALAVGRTIGPISLSGDIGYRTRSNDIPNELFGAVNASVSPVSGVSVYGGVAFVDSTSGIDIGSAGFTPARFPEVEEDYKLWSVGASASIFGGNSLNLSYGQKFDGRNTAQSEFFRAGLGFAF